MKNYNKIFLALLIAICTTQMQADPVSAWQTTTQPATLTPPVGMYTISLLNHTACLAQIVDDPNKPTNPETVAGVDIYSFYYRNPTQFQTRTYYSTVPANQMGEVIIGTGNPSTSPYPYDSLDVGYAPSPAALLNKAYIYGQPGMSLRTYDEYHVIQMYMNQTACTHNSPCLWVVSPEDDPCK